MHARTRALFALIALMCGASSARAEDPVVEARADYDAAAAAYDRADYATAATRFARADERVPNPRALRLAMASALRVSDAGLAMNLVERSEERARSGSGPTDPAVTELAHKLRARFEESAGRIQVSCAAEIPCKPSVDGEAMSPTRARWATPGKHRVVFETGGAEVTREIIVRAGQTVDVPLAATDVAPSSARGEGVATASSSTPAHDDASAARSGLSPAFFWSGVAATGVGAALATVFTVITANRHDDFVEAPSAATADAGDSAQTRARVAWAASGVFAITTVVLGAMTDFGARPSSRARASRSAPRFTVGVGPLAATVAGSFW